MLVRCRWFLAVLLLLAAAPCMAATASPEERALDGALRDLANKLYGRAAAEFAEYALTYPASTNLAEAYLYHAEALLGLEEYSQAIDLLKAHEAQSGKWLEEYAFWEAEAWFRKKDYRTASDLFGRFCERFPKSERGGEAAVRQASACAKLGEWPRVSQLLLATNSAFQRAVESEVLNATTVEGTLLLSEALLEQHQHKTAETLLRPLGPLLQHPELGLAKALVWKRDYLLSRSIDAAGRPEEACAAATNLVPLAVASGIPELRAVSTDFCASLFERLGRLEQAIAGYTNNLTEGTPPEYQRQALLKITELSLQQTNIIQATQFLEAFLAKYSESPPADYARLKLGELRLMQFEAAQGIGRPAGTNTATASPLDEAIRSLDLLVTRFPSSPYFGKAQFNLGWCYWLQTNLPACQASFESAAKHLPFSSDQAIARYKLADALFLQSNFVAAAENYAAVVSLCPSLPQVETNLLESALYQQVRAGLAAQKPDMTTNAMARLLAWYPSGFRAGGAVLLAGQAASQQREPAAARDIYLRYAGTATNSELLPLLRLAVARTHEEQTNWTAAVVEYSHWLQDYTNSNLEPRVRYYCGQAEVQAGHYAEALTCFSNLVERCPRDEQFTPMAQLWIGDYHYGVASPPDYVEAERNYQRLFKGTNWHRPDLSYQAQLMAGRAALRRDGWKDAERYLTNLTSDLSCPLWTEAMFSYGETLTSRFSTNKISDYATAVRVFNQIQERFPTNVIAVEALDRKASCLLQVSAYDEAAGAFQQILTNSMANASQRGKAAVGWAAATEKLAADANELDSEELLDEALDLYLDVLYSKDSIVHPGEVCDSYWTQRAGLDAARLLESRQQWEQAIRVYQDMAELFPPLRPELERKILRDKEHPKPSSLKTPTAGL
jgi:TolA-binding protein